MDDETLAGPAVDAYLARLGLPSPPAPTLAGLQALVSRHLAEVPFENLDVVERRPIVLGAPVAVDKIVRRRRGGFCFELNEAFRALLVAVGYRVRRIEARVWIEAAQHFGDPFDHLALVVTLPEGEYLVDVGFGDNNRAPMRLPDDAVSDVSGRYRLREGRDGLLLLERLPTDDVGAPRPLYAMTLAPRSLGDFAAMCAYHQSSPDSLFMRGLICTLPTPEGRVTLTGGRLIRTEAGTRTEQDVGDPTTLKALLLEHFQIA
jgi:N-hydroxyarylamine O-acetyltransferase